MTDPKELIERLRLWAEHPTWDVPVDAVRADLLAAADALASLSASVGVTVKPLAWRRDYVGKEWHGYGAHNTGPHYTVKDDGRWCLDKMSERIWVSDQAGDIDAAKAAAQADYEARIRSALSLPSSGGEVVALREALEPFARFAQNVDEKGWTSSIHRERISDWFGPSDFRAAARATGPGK